MGIGIPMEKIGGNELGMTRVAPMDMKCPVCRRTQHGNLKINVDKSCLQSS